jgi:hypothetical protein
MADAAGTTQTGAPVDTEAHFDNLWDAGVTANAQTDAGSASGTPTEGAGTATQDVQANAQTAEGAAQTADGSAEPETYENLDALLRAKGIDSESVRSLPVTVKIDGQERSVPLAEVLKSYQLEGHVNNKSIELSNQQRAFEQERQAAQTLAQQMLQRNTDLGNIALQMVNNDYQRVDWNALRAQDPAQYAALHADFQQRSSQVQQYLQALDQQRAQAAQEQQQKSAQTLQEQQQRMYEARPQWRDDAVFKQDREQMVKYAHGLGFSDAEIGSLSDHRNMLVLHDAARYAALQASAPQAAKRVREAPVQVKPGARVNTNPQDANRQAAIERFNRNPRDQDAAAAAFEFLS